jgi:hypothetical protein
MDEPGEPARKAGDDEPERPMLACHCRRSVRALIPFARKPLITRLIAAVLAEAAQTEEGEWTTRNQRKAAERRLRRCAGCW